MNLRLMMTAIFVSSMAGAAMADDLVPATSEDISQFDRQFDAQQRRAQAQSNSTEKGQSDKGAAMSAGKGKSQDAFGKLVSAEAKKLKDATPEQRKEFGAWVKGQRARDDQGRPSSASDASNRASVESGVANGSAAPGNSGTARGGGNGHGKK